jgi:hypothetical protein
VEVLIRERVPADADDPTGWQAAEALIGFIDDVPADMAENHDHNERRVVGSDVAVREPRFDEGERLVGEARCRRRVGTKGRLFAG